MPNETLNEREFELINIVGSELGSSQRDLSHHIDLSLGATNMLLRRLIAKGYIRIGQLNKRKVKYILTPKGFSEKLKKSVKYTLKTIKSIELIKANIKEIILPSYEQGERSFIVLGRSDFALLIEMVFRESGFEGYKIIYVDKVPSFPWEGRLLICKENIKINPQYAAHTLDVIYELARQNNFFKIDLEEKGDVK